MKTIAEEFDDAMPQGERFRDGYDRVKAAFFRGFACALGRVADMLMDERTKPEELKCAVMLWQLEIAQCAPKSERW